MEIRPLERSDEPALSAFFARVPESDRTFFKEDVSDPDIVAGWARATAGRRALAIDDAEVAGYVAVVPLHGWSSHVGEVRLVVDPARRGRGIGRALARRALLDAVDLGLAKAVVEVVADQEPAIAMFQAIGFSPEALLRDHVRDRGGALRDLIVLAHSMQENWSAMASVGIVDAL